MEWINLKYERPPISGPYLISVNKVSENYFFNYYAFYNAETSQWYEYNPVDGSKNNIINEKVIGWLKGLTNYLG